MSSLKYKIIGLLLFIIVIFIFVWEWGWTISLFFALVLIYVLFSKKGGSIFDAFKMFKAEQKELKIEQKEEDQEQLIQTSLNDFKPKKGAKIAVALSGGVDSATSAYLLKKEGYELKAFFMVNWDSAINSELNYILTDDEVCQQTKDYLDAKKVADFLGIELIRINFIKQYWDLVFQKFLKEIKMGITPNPDIFCNKYIKFKEFTDYIFKNYPELEYVSTGHYASIKTKDDDYFLGQAIDEFKDQTYFLSEIDKKILNKIYFPLANLKKSEVRKIAIKANLPTATKKDSTGICFIGKRNFPDFIANYLKDKPGKIIDQKTNKVIGKHRGVLFYTLGQRRGLNLSGNKEPYFVSKKDVKKNILYVATEKNPEFLYSNYIETENFNLLAPLELLKDFVWIKTRHSEIQYEAEILNVKNTKNKLKITIKTKEDIKAVTPGQEVVIYKHKLCLGGGQITKNEFKI
ncbi:tRNA-specific 2-thiouridylase mnmA [Candidatus Hepatoplasma crinochetorum Av]|uniref:tRNA-specific 2-thiouridylase MnmA n=1 Tax=Candidatus Hepatoplasma crinochetorum Av TaxID=1427984 RepID=W8GEJ3_9MOLU|nr:tRNA 2-thiouridine(34) synthase MnmA [Candidatus Hepatoplasma crinochetorum]AHK22224.1 tRNA-specific 2-thiouridylase mnmA [Candidatus Hepatoplasma crinochetorum Av]